MQRTNETSCTEPIDGPDGALARRPTKWDVSAAPGNPAIMRPLRVRAYTRQGCITSGEALNLVDPEVGHAADWHAACWRTIANPPPYADHSDDAKFRAVAAAVGGERVFDCRNALAAVMHPAAKRTSPVWCAHHDRAILDMAWANWEASGFSLPWPLAPRVVDDWIWTPKQMDSLRTLAERVESEVPSEQRGRWRKWWRDDLRFGQGALRP